MVAVFPIDRRGHAVAGGQLQRVDHAQNLVKVAARAGRISDHELDLLVRSNNEDRADGEHIADLRVDHVVELSDFVIWIGDYRKVERGPLRLANVFSPTLV